MPNGIGVLGEKYLAIARVHGHGRKLGSSNGAGCLQSRRKGDQHSQNCYTQESCFVPRRSHFAAAPKKLHANSTSAGRLFQAVH